MRSAKDLRRAEATLRRASAKRERRQARQQNLALVVGLQGRFQEAETIARADLPPSEAAANVAYLRQMLAQKGGTAAAGMKKTIRSRPVEGLDPVDESGS